MEFWSSFWTVVLIGALGLFAILAIVVTVRGAQDVKALMRSLGTDKKEEEEE